MVKDKVSIRIIVLILVVVGILYIIVVSSPRLLPPNYCYRYSLGKIEIENPVGVSIDRNEYVCPDSAVKYCSDSNWINRADVHPYIFMVEEDELPVFYSSLLHKTRFWDKYYYSFYYADTVSQCYKQNIKIFRFYYDITTFDAYMQATYMYWYVSEDPEWSDPSSDSCDAYAYSDRYRIAVRQHYTTWQIIQLRWHTRKKQKDPEYIGFHNILK